MGGVTQMTAVVGGRNGWCNVQRMKGMQGSWRGPVGAKGAELIELEMSREVLLGLVKRAPLLYGREAFLEVVDKLI